MKIYKPLFSFIVILIQLILSVTDYFELEKWSAENPELYKIISLNITYETLFLFVLIIGVYEMLIKPSLLKSVIRIFMICIVLGTQFSGLIPMEDFYFGVYNTAWFLAVVAFILTLVKIGKFGIEKLIDKKQNKA